MDHVELEDEGTDNKPIRNEKHKKDVLNIRKAHRAKRTKAPLMKIKKKLEFMVY